MISTTGNPGRSPVSGEFSRTSRAHDIATIIRREILTGRWAQGDQVDDRALSEELGVSRNSVREALAQLIALKIIESRHWKGYFVVSLTSEDISSILDTRQLLESAAFRGFLYKMNDENRRKIISRMKAAVIQSGKDLKLKDQQAFHTSDFQIHEIIHENCGNRWIPVLIDQVRFFWDILRVQDKKYVFHNSAQASIVDHQKLIELLEKKEDEKAVEFFNRHLEGHRRRVHETIE